jgi:hypothetical protein
MPALCLLRARTHHDRKSAPFDIATHPPADPDAGSPLWLMGSIDDAERERRARIMRHAPELLNELKVAAELLVDLRDYHRQEKSRCRPRSIAAASRWTICAGRGQDNRGHLAISAARGELVRDQQTRTKGRAWGRGFGTTTPTRAFDGDGTLDEHRDQAAYRLRFERPARPDRLRYREEHYYLDQND